MISQNEFIICDSYERMVMLAGRDDLIHVTTAEIADYFAKTGDNKKLTVVSSNSDFSVRHQMSNHPNRDLVKHASAINWSYAQRDTSRYGAVKIGPACDTQKCRNDDQFCIKTDRFTPSTFSRIPANVRWFCTNLDIRHPLATWIPFGINYHGHGKDILANYQGRPKKGLLYVNLQNNSFERLHIKNHFRHQPWVTFRENANLPVEQYYEETAEHQFVLSPAGNGLDCFRSYEAMYLGAIPIVDDTVMSYYMKENGMPVLTCPNWSTLNAAYLRPISVPPEAFDCPTLTLSYWRNKIRG